MIFDFIAVGTGGALGAVARYAMGFLNIRHRSGFPLSTLLINVVGALIIGFIAAYAGKNAKLDPRLVLFLKVGLCGGFTTFSSFALETVGLMQTGSSHVGVLYAGLSVILCVVACAVPQLIIR